MYPCAEFCKPEKTREALKRIGTGQSTALQALKRIVMAKPPPRNDNFVQVYNTGNAPHDLVFILHGEKFKGHQFVFNA